MATLALGALGAGIAAAASGGALTAIAFGLNIGMAVGGILAPIIAPNSAGRLSDLRVTGSTYGEFIPQVWGEMRIGGQIIWATELQEHAPGGSGMKQSSYTYTVSMAVMICAGPVDHVQRIWAEDVVIYDASQSPPTRHNVAVYPGDEVQTADPTMQSFLAGLGLPCPAHRGYCYAVFTNLDLTNWGSRIPVMSFDVVAARSSVADILDDVFTQAGLSVSDVDLSRAVGSVTGYMLTDRRAGSEQLLPLTVALNADLVEVDGKIAWRPRGDPPFAQLPLGDLAATSWEGGVEASPTVSVKRRQDRELPVSVEVSYYSPARQFQQASQRAVRYSKNFQQDSCMISLPMAMTDDDGRQLAERTLYVEWFERLTMSAVTSIRWLEAAPGDVVMVPVAGRQVRARIDSMEHEPFGAVSLALKADDNLLLDQVISGVESAGGQSQFFGTVAASGYAWNGPAAYDADADTVGIYWAASGPPGWEGATAYVSRDGGSSWQAMGRTVAYAPVGQSIGTLAAGTGTAFADWSRTLDVQMVRGSLASASASDVLNGANFAVLGGELLQFSTVTVLDPALLKFRLSGLIRGQRGTDQFWSHPSPGEGFVVLSSGLANRHALDLSAAGKTLKVAFVAGGQSIGTVTPIDVFVGGYELWPYSGCDLTGARDVSHNLTVAWVRRARERAQWADLIDVPLDETAEAYEVDVMNGMAVVRTISSSVPSASYTAAQQASDFGSAQPSVSLAVYQLGLLGRGFPLKGTV